MRDLIEGLFTFCVVILFIVGFFCPIFFLYLFVLCMVGGCYNAIMYPEPSKKEKTVNNNENLLDKSVKTNEGNMLITANEAQILTKTRQQIEAEETIRIRDRYMPVINSAIKVHMGMGCSSVSISSRNIMPSQSRHTTNKEVEILSEELERNGYKVEIKNKFLSSEMEISWKKIYKI